METSLHTLSQTPQTDYLKGGILLIDKPLDWTSFDVVNKVRRSLLRKFNKKLKVGHAGTLDPLATGLLIICTGAFTKRINEVQDQEKEYTGVFVLGATRPSYDKETEIDATYPTEHITEELIQQVAKTFVGEIEQVPPAHSAIKVDGKRAYESARKGVDVKMSPRIVSIKEMEVKLLDATHMHFRVVCSKGTYIRSLARDFGLALKSGAYLDSLVRTRIGDFRLTQAMTMDEVYSLLAVEEGTQLQ
jgi:tRNA pseudouridine55 synthase